MNRFRRQQRIVLVGTMLLAGGAVFGQEPAKHNNIFGTLAFVGGTHYSGRVALDFKTKRNWLIGAVGVFFTEKPGNCLVIMHFITEKGFLVTAHNP